MEEPNSQMEEGSEEVKVSFFQQQPCDHINGALDKMCGLYAVNNAAQVEAITLSIAAEAMERMKWELARAGCRARPPEIFSTWGKHCPVWRR